MLCWLSGDPRIEFEELEKPFAISATPLTPLVCQYLSEQTAKNCNVRKLCKRIPYCIQFQPDLPNPLLAACSVNKNPDVAHEP